MAVKLTNLPHHLTGICRLARSKDQNTTSRRQLAPEDTVRVFEDAQESDAANATKHLVKGSQRVRLRPSCSCAFTGTPYGTLKYSQPGSIDDMLNMFNQAGQEKGERYTSLALTASVITSGPIPSPARTAMLFDTVPAPWLNVSNDSALLVVQASGQEQERRNPRLEATLESLYPDSMMAIASVRLILLPQAV